jgi:outer membrane beta-barrel protein
MRSLQMIKILVRRVVLLTCIFCPWAKADLMEDFDSLGGNDVLYEKAKDLNPEQKVYVVQDRIVNRNWRMEFSPEYASVLGGDNFLNTRKYGFNVHLHVNPKFSFGVRYMSMTNTLSQDGENLISDTSQVGRAFVPDIDFPKDEMLGQFSIYPIYGKMNLADLGIAHFDVYMTLGMGRMNLRSGSSSTWQAGGGVGFWISQHFSSRLELRYQNHKAQRTAGEYDVNTTVAGLQFGYLL